MSTTNLPGVKGRPARKADNLTANYEPIVYKMWEPRRLTTLWASWPVTGIALPFFFTPRQVGMQFVGSFHRESPTETLTVSYGIWRQADPPFALGECQARAMSLTSSHIPVQPSYRVTCAAT
jgi:hypothetical protein